MKLIHPEKSTTVSASTENANYPANNVLDNHPLKEWRATATTATLTVNCNAGITGVCLVNVTANQGGTLTVKDAGDDSTLYTEDLYFDFLDSYQALIADDREEWKDTWIDIPYQPGATYLEIALEDTTVPAIGVVSVGTVQEYPNPDYGLGEDRISHSVAEELNNGAKYRLPRNVVRNPHGQIVLNRDEQYWGLMRTLDALAGDPVAILLVSGMTTAEYEWVLYGSFASYSGNHKHLSHSTVTFKVEEEI